MSSIESKFNLAVKEGNLIQFLRGIYNNFGETALMIATRYDKINVLENIIKAGASLDIQDIGRNTALIKSVQYDQIDKCECLIKAGASIDIQNNRNINNGMLYYTDNIIQPAHMNILFSTYE